MNRAQHTTTSTRQLARTTRETPMHRAVTIASAAAALTLGNAALADFQRFEDVEAWQSAAGAFTTIGFDDFPVATRATATHPGDEPS